MTPQMQRRIRERWEEIFPILTLEARRVSGMPVLLLGQWKEIHAQRVEMLLLRGVRLRKIREHSWDDPTYTPELFARKLRLAVDNLRKRNRTVPAKGLAKFQHSDLPSPTGRTGDER